MREIKFRAWDANCSRMVYAFNVEIDGGDNEIYIFTQFKDGTFGVIREGEEERLPLMHFTGLRDKNGREIYEGDVVRDVYGQVNAITFGGGSFWFNWLEMPHYLGQVEKGEVIGNIYENPELVQP